MKPDEYKKIQILKRSALEPGSVDKMFIHFMADLPESTELTESQVDWINKIHNKYYPPTQLDLFEKEI